ncbi:MAG: hypothetical protein K0A90_06970 [Methanosarcinaceae archaeon]|nr:hypothetical protein [Methanosarcinaceae archaeon]
MLIATSVCLAEEVVDETEFDWTQVTDVNEQSITWVEYSKDTMKLWDTINVNDSAIGDFTIGLTDVMKDAVGSKLVGALLTITGDNKTSQVVIGNYESQIVIFDPPFNNEMKISANFSEGSIWGNEVIEPKATVRVFLRGKPEMDIKYNIYSENPENKPYLNVTDDMRSNKLFYVQVILDNKGNGTLKNIKLEMNNTDFKFVKGQDIRRSGMDVKNKENSIVYDLNEMKVDDITILNISVIAPTTPVNRDYSIPLILTGSDEKNVVYTYRTKHPLTIKPFIEINKQVGPYLNYLGNDVLYVGENFSTDIKIINHGGEDVMIHLKDFVPDSFEYQTDDNKSLNWSITIPAKSSHTISYLVKPLRYETVIIPKATVSFEFNGTEYSVESNDLNIKVIGSDILLNKATRIDGITDGILNATIRITAKNQGDQRVSIRINDSLPNNASLISGNISKDSFFLEIDESFVYFYEISLPQEDIIFLPPAIGYIMDFRSYMEKNGRNKDNNWRKIESNRPSIDTREPAPTEPENTTQYQENMTLEIQDKEESKTKLWVIKRFIGDLIKSILGENGSQETGI